MTTQLERGEESVPQQEEENIPEDAKDLATYVCCRFLFFRDWSTQCSFSQGSKLVVSDAEPFSNHGRLYTRKK